jgi:hypothetical protein
MTSEPVEQNKLKHINQARKKILAFALIQAYLATTTI